MPEDQPRRIRKGAKSCTECRRRKVRCIQSYVDAQICRRCEERDLQCVAQTHTSGTNPAQKSSSRHRIAELESKVLSLTETIREIQQQLESQSSQDTELSPSQYIGANDPIGSFSVLERSIAEQPSHLRLLVQNDWLSMDSSRDSQSMQGSGVITTPHLLDSARRSLQRLIPSKDDLRSFTTSASEWLTMLNSLFPLPSMAKCREEVVACYDDMHSPQVDVMQLASWLLTIALIAEQLPQEQESAIAQLERREEQRRLSKIISGLIETKVLAHDSLISSVQGLSIAMQFVRLEIGRGNIHNAWLKLRRAIAIAELIGLPKMAAAAEDGAVTVAGADETHISESQLWDLICAADQLLGMMLNLAPITSRHQPETMPCVSINGVVEGRSYLRRLTDIANKIQHLDKLSMTHGSRLEVSTFSLKLSGELKMLASQTPETWWSEGAHGAQRVNPDHIIQFLHYYVMMRIHLPLTLRHGPNGENYFSCLACIDACESVVQRYQFLSRGLPPGLFLSEMLDLQAYTAATTLLLISHMSSIPYLELGVDRIKIINEVGQVIKLLHGKLPGTAGSKIAHHGFTTLSSLNELLQGIGNDTDLGHKTFHAPLLGKVHVRRNVPSSQSNSLWSFQLLSDLGCLGTSDQLSPLGLDANMSVVSSFDTENLSWDGITYYDNDILETC